MSLVLHDTMAREKRPFEPADPKRVTVYVCGPTVYNYAHVGNARPVVVFDVLFRLLRHIYGAEAVVYARNITDVDDKINAKAAEEGVDISVITRRFTDIYHQDMDALGALRPTLEPRATDHIEAMVDLIGRLIAQGCAYAAEGHVLFDTQAFPDYGKLSGRSIDDMIAGARVEVAPYKRHPADFVLWKPSKPGEPEWPSPWGGGRPGWHLECSAMIEQNLGLPIDIHGGGHDLIFPHHENEVAQSGCAKGGGQLARYWIHNGFLTMGAEKMSKSLGNVLLVHDLVKEVQGEVIRWALLSAHYRAPLDWTGRLLEQAKTSLDKLYQALRDAKAVLSEDDDELLYYTPTGAIDPRQVIAEDAETLFRLFLRALEADLNTPRAQSALFKLGGRLRTSLDLGPSPDVRVWRDTLVAAGALMGVLQQDPDTWFQGRASEDLAAKVEELLEQRDEARRAKDWANADRIRAELDGMGVVVMDGPEGATWRMRD